MKLKTKCKCGKVHEVEVKTTRKTTSKQMEKAEKELDVKLYECKQNH